MDESICFMQLVNRQKEPVAIIDVSEGAILWSNENFKRMFLRDDLLETESELRRILFEDPSLRDMRQRTLLGPPFASEEPIQLSSRLGSWQGIIQICPVFWSNQSALMLNFETTVMMELRYREALQKLSSSPVISSGDFDSACRLIARTASESIGSSRAGVWLLKDNVLSSKVTYDRAKDLFEQAHDFNMNDYPKYCVMLYTDRYVPIRDTEQETVLPDLADYYLSFDIRALLVCPIRLNGKFQGVVCCEHESPRDWTQEELSFGASLTDFASIALESRNLRESERRLSLLVSNLPGAAFRCRVALPKMTMKYLSEGAREIFGYTPEELVNDRSVRFNSLLPDEELERVLMIKKDALENDKPIDITFRIRRQDGEIRYICERSRLSRSLVDSTGGTIFEGLFTDVTEQMLMEEENLINRAMCGSLANLSHAIRTPLNAVIGFSELLRDTQQTPQQLEYTESIRLHADALWGMIDSIHDFSMIEAGKIQQEKVVFSPRQILEELAESYFVKAVEKNLRLDVDIDLPIPFQVDENVKGFRQVIVNLLDNAVKYTSSGKITLRCYNETDWDSAQYPTRLMIEILDTGIGIPPGQLDYLFEPFLQTKDTNTPSGIGLGLPLCKRILALMGGTIAVRSELGHGSIFQVELPVHTVESESAHHLQLEECRVLVFEDQVSSRHSIRRVLKCCNVNVETVDCYEDFVRVINRTLREELPPDLILAILDSNAAKIQQRLENCDQLLGDLDTKIMLLADCGQPIPPQLLDANRVIGVLTRPMKSEMLLHYMDKYFGHKRHATAALPTRRFETRSEENKSLRVLLVEDMKINQVITTARLKTEGHQVEIAENGSIALEKLREKEFDLVLMDCQMPVMDGYEATRIIRTAESGVLNPSIPIIALTAHALPGDREKCLESGMDDYMTKPIHASTLRQFLSKWSR